MNKKEWPHILIVFAFLLILALGFLNQSFRIVRFKTLNENRELTKKPKLRSKTLKSYPGEYEKYYNDYFSLKRPLVSLMNSINMDFFKKPKLSGSIIKGKDDWLFATKKDLPVFLGKKILSTVQKQKLKIEFEKRLDFFEARGIKMYIYIIPSKYSIYHDKLPGFLKLRKEMPRTNQFIDILNDIPGIKYIDGRKELLKRRRNQTVHLKYDTHWNGMGALYAFTDLMNFIRKDFPSIPNIPIEDFKIDTFKKTQGNMKYILPNRDEVFEPDYKVSLDNYSIKRIDKGEYIKFDEFPYSQNDYYRKYTSNYSDESFPNVIFIRDSYLSFNIDYLPHFFNNSTLIWDNWQFMLNEEIIESEKPDIVIYYMYERYVDRILMNPSFVEPELINKDLQ